MSLLLPWQKSSGGSSVSATAADTLTTSETVTRTETLLRTAADTFTVSTTLAGVVGGRTAEDVVTTSDSVARTGTFARIESDTLTVSDAVIGTRVFVRTASDTLTISTSVARAGAFARTATNTVTFSTAIVASSRFTAADTLTISTSVSRIANLQRAFVADYILTSDQIHTSKVFRTATDTITVGTSVHTSKIYVTASDTLGVASSVSAPTALVQPPATYTYIGGTYIGGSGVTGGGGSNGAGQIEFATANFTQYVNGKPGEAYMRIRDLDSTVTINEGDDWLMTVNGAAVWRGFVTQVIETYYADVVDLAAIAPMRVIDLRGSDMNLLFTKRVVFKKSAPSVVEGTQFAAGTNDTVAITELLNNWLDLSSDSLNTTSDVVHVGDLDPDQPTRAWSGGWYWADAMNSIATIPAAIYYIRPEIDSPHGTLVYGDVDVPTAPFGLSDQPNGTTTRGYREMEVTKDGTSLANDVLGIGMGYGSQTPVYNRTIDSASVSEHGLWQTSSINTGVYKQGTIDRIVDSVINGSPSSHRGTKDDRPYVSLVTYETGLLAGHVVSFESNIWGFSDVIPVRQMTLTFEAPDVPRYELILSHEIDAPWGFIDQFWPPYFSPQIPCLTPPCISLPPPPLPPLPSCPTACMFASCAIDSFDRTVLAPDWGGGWSTVLSTADGGGMAPTTANVVDLTTWNIARSLSPQSETSTHRLDLSGCTDTAGPWEYATSWTADNRFDSQQVFNTLNTPPPGQKFFPADYYFDGSSQCAAPYQLLEFYFLNTAWTSSTGNQTLVRIAMDSIGGGSYWGLMAAGGADAFRTVDLIPFSFSAGVTYGIRLSLDTTNVNVRMWDMAGAEPVTWDITRAHGISNASHLIPAAFDTLYSRGMTLDTGACISFGSAPPSLDAVKIDLECGDFDYVCDNPVIPAPVSPVNLDAIETALRLTSSIYTTTRYFAPNSTTVWRDGVKQTLGVDYSENTDNQSITFVAPVTDPATVVKISYVATPTVGSAAPTLDIDFSNGMDPRLTATYQAGDPGYGLDSYFLSDLSQCSVSNGIMTITAQYDATLPAGRTYRSASVGTNGTFSQRYGTFEARIKYPAGQGVFPAFWLLSPGTPVTPPEIDIFEAFPAPPGPGGGSGTNYLSSGLNTSLGIYPAGGPDAPPYYYDTRGDLTLDWHVHRMVWTPTSLTLYIDDINRGTYTNVTKLNTIPAMYPIVTFALGAYLYRTDGTTPHTLTMDIDYIRAWASWT